MGRLPRSARAGAVKDEALDTTQICPGGYLGGWGQALGGTSPHAQSIALGHHGIMRKGAARWALLGLERKIFASRIDGKWHPFTMGRAGGRAGVRLPRALLGDHCMHLSAGCDLEEPGPIQTGTTSVPQYFSPPACTLVSVPHPGVA